VGLGPALRIKVTATYVEPDHQPEIDTATWPSLAPNEQTNFSISVRFDPLPSSIRLDGFPLSGTFLDRSQLNEYPIITSWSVPESAI
jgi:hypothetical protein